MLLDEELQSHVTRNYSRQALPLLALLLREMTIHGHGRAIVKLSQRCLGRNHRDILNLRLGRQASAVDTTSGKTALHLFMYNCNTLATSPATPSSISSIFPRHLRIPSPRVGPSTSTQLQAPHSTPTRTVKVSGFVLRRMPVPLFLVLR